ncbi:MAG: alpha/beta hydrolase [Actinomycetota bacterium]|nr:alpha/beta hydrolase [Actinomycetota bacterium]
MRKIMYHGRDGWPLFAVAVGAGPVLLLLHGGGPDHQSLLPIAERLADVRTVVVPDIRGYGRSVCADPALHTWRRYVDDVVSLLDHLGAASAAVGGTGMGGTIALRACMAFPQRFAAAIVISLEDIEDDDAKAAETALMDRFADRIHSDGLDAAWKLFLPMLQPLIGSLVRDAIPRTNPASAAAAAAIGRDRAFRTVDELASISVPVLIVPGADERHPSVLAEQACAILPKAQLASVTISSDLRTADDLAGRIAPGIRQFLTEPGTG